MTHHHDIDGVANQTVTLPRRVMGWKLEPVWKPHQAKHLAGRKQSYPPSVHTHVCAV